MGSGRDFWLLAQKVKPFLATMYVIACGIRAMWPRMDEHRGCFYDHPISLVVVGRSLATVAELSFCAQLCLATLTVTGRYGVANLVMISNVVAQSCCWYSVITQDQRGHTVEESIWLLSGVAWTCSAFVASEAGLSKDAVSFRRGMLIAGPLYVLFMALVDVPMYYNRYLHDASIGRVYQTFTQGLNDIWYCKYVSKSDKIWIPEMPWVSLYFSFAVWTSIWLGRAQISSASTAVDISKKDKKNN